MSDTGGESPRDENAEPALENGSELEADDAAKAQADAERAALGEEDAGAVDEADEAADEDEEEEADEVAEPTPAEQIAELKDQVLRARAETENVRRRAAREKEDASRYAMANFARDMLGVSDNMHRALDAVPEDARGGDDAMGSLWQGVEMTERELLAALERHGIKRLDPVGEKFDHNLHQAMFEVPGADAEPGTVVQVVQAGYVIGERLLRPAMVGVAKAAPAAAENSGDEEQGSNGEDSGGKIDTSA